MGARAEWGREYLEQAEKIRERIAAAKAETGPDFQGKRAKRIALLEDMYYECTAIGGYLIRTDTENRRTEPEKKAGRHEREIRG